MSSHKILVRSFKHFFDYPGKATSMMAAYVSDGVSVQSHFDIESPADALLLLRIVKRWIPELEHIAERQGTTPTSERSER